MNESNLDRALAAGFGAPTDHSVLRAIERITGEAPRILLRDADSKSGASPLIDPSSSEKHSIPQGRGSYQILGEIARGGMGVVMKGHDNDLGRDVALKVLHKELAKRPEVLQRFVEEAQIGGQLQHPGIVPVYELGLMADERPYFTMKLVKGRTLAALLAERKSAGVDRRRLLDVFESVCQTMAYAHSRGVIHRDLKPANVMVGAFGEVQVVDWGLAKVLRHGGTADEKRQKQTNISIIETVRSEPGSHGSHSLVGSVMGTPAYMSPEQARGEVEKLDERSDVFSLGAILCEILTGVPPYLGESEKTLVEAANAKLDEATKRLDGCEADPELVALCRECLAPAQSVRPRSAEVLAQRIHDHLVSVEERARQAHVEAAEARVKAQEERRARKLTVGLAASVLVTMLVAGGGWAWMSTEKSRRERDTETQVNVALNEATLKRGEGQWAEALAAVERAKGLAESGAASDELRGRVSSVLTAIETETKTARAKDELARDNVALLAELADIRQPEGDTIYPTDWAKLDAEHGAIFGQHNLDLGSQTELEAVAALNARGISIELAAALDEWASVRSRADDTPGAAHLSSLARRIDADATRNKLRDGLLASDVATLKAIAANEDLVQLPATTLHLLGKALRKNEAVDDAIAVFRQAQQSHPGDFMLTMSLARALLYATPAIPEEAARYYTAALALRPSSVEAVHELGKTLEGSLKDHARAAELFRNATLVHPDDGHLRAHLASSLDQVGTFDAAVATAREAIALAPKDAWAHSILGHALFDKGDLDGAILAYRDVIELDPQFADAYRMLGFALKNAHDLDGALAAFGRAIEIDPKFADAYRGLGSVLGEKNDHDGEIAAYRKAIQIDPQLADGHSDLGASLAMQGEFDASIASSRTAIDLDPRLVTARFNLGLGLRLKGDLDGAVAAFKTAIELDPKLATAHFTLGLTLKDKGDLDGAIAAFQKAIECDPKLPAEYSTLGRALQAKGDVDGAINAYRKTLELDPLLAMTHGDLGRALRSKGDLDGAIAAYRKAIELDPKYVAAYANMGDALQHNGDVDGAIAAELTAIDLDPKCTVAYINLGAVLNDNKGDHDGAIAAFRKAIELGPKSAEAHCNLGIALEANDDLDGALAAYRTAVALDPKNSATRSRLISVLQRNDDLGGAIEAYRDAIELDPANREWSSALAWLLATCADPARRDGIEAVRLARRGIEFAPDDPNSFDNLGAALCCAGEWSQAIEALDHSIQLNRSTSDFGPYLNAVNHCFLANAHAHLGEMDTARADFALAKSWNEAHPKHANAVETARILDEARAAIEAGARR